MKEKMQELLNQINQDLALKPMNAQQVKELSELKEKLEAAVKVF